MQILIYSPIDISAIISSVQTVEDETSLEQEAAVTTETILLYNTAITN
jgi:hypothetical protein